MAQGGTGAILESTKHPFLLQMLPTRESPMITQSQGQSGNEVGSVSYRLKLQVLKTSDPQDSEKTCISTRR